MIVAIYFILLFCFILVSRFLFYLYILLLWENVQGKTLAFVLPILESLTNGPAKAARRIGYGRSPSVLVLLPTRELANQV